MHAEKLSFCVTALSGVYGYMHCLLPTHRPTHTACSSHFIHHHARIRAASKDSGTSGACMSRVGPAWHQQLQGSPLSAVCGMHFSGLSLVGTPTSPADGGPCCLQGRATSSVGANRTSCMQCPVLLPGARIYHPVTKQLQLLPSRPQLAGLVLSVPYCCQCCMIACLAVSYCTMHSITAAFIYTRQVVAMSGWVCWAQHIPIHLHPKHSRQGDQLVIFNRAHVALVMALSGSRITQLVQGGYWGWGSCCWKMTVGFFIEGCSCDGAPCVSQYAPRACKQ